MLKSEDERLAESLERLGAPPGLIAKAKAPPLQPLEAMRSLIGGGVVADADGIKEIFDHFRWMATNSPKRLIEGLSGIESVLENPPAEEGLLAHIVAWEANWVLEDDTDEEAKKWLREIAEMIRNILGEKAPPRLEETK